MNPPKIYYSDNNPAIYWTVTAIITIAFTAMFILMPSPVIDDYCFLSSGSIHNPPPDSVSWLEATINNFIFRITYDNGRIPNLILTGALLAVPGWLFCIGLGICMLLMIYLAARISGVWCRSLTGFAILVFGIVICLPWHDYMFVKAVATNYLVTSVLLLMSTWLILHPRTSSTALTLIFVLLTSLWHEMAMAGIAAGIVGLVLVFPQYRTQRMAYIAATLVAAAVYYFAIPATHVRSAKYTENLFSFEFLRNPLFSIHLAIPSFFLILTLILLAVRRTRQLIFKPVPAFMVGMALGSALIFWFFHDAGLRTVWTLMLASFIGLAFITAAVLPSRKIFRFIAYVLLFAATVQPCACIPWFYKYNRDWKAIITKSKKSKGLDDRFVDYIMPQHYPLYCLEFTAGSKLLPLLIPPYPQIVHSSLADFNPAKAQSIGIGREAYLYKDNIIIPTVDAHAVRIIVYFDGKPLPIYASSIPFTTVSGTYSCICPINIYSLYKHRKITGVGDIIEIDPKDFYNPNYSLLPKEIDRRFSPAG